MCVPTRTWSGKNGWRNIWTLPQYYCYNEPTRTSLLLFLCFFSPDFFIVWLCFLGDWKYLFFTGNVPLMTKGSENWYSSTVFLVAVCHGNLATPCSPPSTTTTSTTTTTTTNPPGSCIKATPPTTPPWNLTNWLIKLELKIGWRGKEEKKQNVGQGSVPH